MTSTVATDYFVPIPSHEEVCAEIAKTKLLSGYRTPLKALMDSLVGLDLRMRFNPEITGPYLIATEDYVGRYTVETYINNLSHEQRPRFLAEAKMQEPPLCLLKSAKSTLSRRLALRS